MKREFWAVCFCLLAGYALGAEDEATLFPFSARGAALSQVWQAPDSLKIAGAEGPIRVEGDRFVNDVGEVRFWGVNTCFSMNFPDKTDAEAYAKRMADFGVNVVRLHHMDSRDIWGKNAQRTLTEIDPEQLDRLDWFIYQLHQHGIYVNINLHVSRKLDGRDGFSDAPGSPNQNKGIDNFMPRMIQLQKRYAHDLLTHVNPYTKKSYCEDPGVAMIEINNENSVVASWFWGDLDHLPQEYTDELQKQWNQWLAKRYATNDALREEWGCRTYPFGESLIPDFGRTESLSSSWFLEPGNQSQATLQRTDDANPILRLTVERMGTNPWNPQFYYRGIAVKKGVPYTVKFRARANRECQIHLSALQMNANWESVGLRTTVALKSDWQEFTFPFLGMRDESQARIGFSNFAPGTFEFDDFSICPGGVVGLAEGETLESGTIPLIRRSNSFLLGLEGARRDFTQFLLELEEKYWQEMYRYIKEELHATAPITGTQLRYGSHYAQAALDYCDIHEYWNHPIFPGRSWDGGNWYVQNRALANTLGRRTALTGLASNRVLGRPFTVSEYNHPYPNLYGAECGPMIASMAAFQGWNGIFIFAWSHTNQIQHPEYHLPSFFDIQANPAQLVHFPASRNLFVRGDVRSAKTIPGAEKTVYELGRSQEQNLIVKAFGGYHRATISTFATPERALTTHTGVRLSDLPISDPTTQNTAAYPHVENASPATKTTSPEAELIWNAEVEKRGFYQVDTPNTKIFTGFPQDRTFAFADGTTLRIGKTLLDWATVSLTRTGERKMLLAATGLLRNTNSLLGIYHTDKVKNVPVSEMSTLLDKQITYCKDPGNAPVLCEGIPATLTLPKPEGVETVHVYPLDDDGRRKQEILTKTTSDGKVEISLSPEHQTLWYEIAW